ncbi:MAG: 23S rRNA (guanosine(2251)-2'-O)-methyltransferase RlmB [Gammaproteobacteria bacterium]|nr:23S rRNA (guanosine(2251)-2'-O)-methyltransferase RlmB [Gammaproteobacteria bacterium]
MREDAVGGWHAVLALLKTAPERVLSISLDRARKGPRRAELLQAARQAGVAVEETDNDNLDRMSGHTHHQGVVARCRPAEEYGEADLPGFLENLDGTPFLLVLDGVQDPHNLGACLRSADAAGVQAVILPRDNSAPLTPVVSKVASGAAETVPVIRVTNLARTLDVLKEAGVWLVGAAGETDKDIYTIDLTGPLALVMGAEGTGLRRLTREKCDHLAHIPMAGTVESLNVSVATGICLFEAVRQRRKG